MNSGIPYFPFDVHLDDKFELIEAEFGLKGFAIVVKLFQRIYGGQGYYCKWTEDVILLFNKALGTGGNIVSEIVEASIRRGIFDKELFEKYHILTSKGIQTRYFEAVSRRKKVTAQKEYLLVEVAQICKNVSILSKNVNTSSENINISKQRKEEERKEEKSKEEESKEAENGNVTATSAADKIIHKYENLIGLATPSVAEGIDYYISQGMEEELIIRIIEYACEQNKRSWQYINAVLLGNLKEEVRTLSEYNRKQAERRENTPHQSLRDSFSSRRSLEKARKSKFNNYVDTNKHDYSNIQEEILKEMMGE